MPKAAPESPFLPLNELILRAVTESAAVKGLIETTDGKTAVLWSADALQKLAHALEKHHAKIAHDPYIQIRVLNLVMEMMNEFKSEVRESVVSSPSTAKLILFILMLGTGLKAND